MRERKSSQYSFKGILYVLFIYVLLQLIWWGTLLSRLNKEVLLLKYENINLKANQLRSNADEIVLLKKKISDRNIMFLGEGLVFTIILSFGIFRLLKVRNAETKLSLQQHNFTLSVTHELKSPLASAKLQIETILKRMPDPDVQKKLLKNAISDIDRLNNLTDNILTVAQLDNDNFSLNLEAINAGDLLESIVYKIAAKSDRQIVFKYIEKFTFNLDINAFNSIVNNLIENAIKYSSSSTQVEISLFSNNGKLVLIVSDSGIGISDSDKALVFNKFFRVGNEETRKSKGTGLGLFILKQLVEKHGGNVQLEDNLPTGCKFIVTI